MAECECLVTCPFFNDEMKELPGLTKLYKKNYCLGGENEQCARHMVKAAIGKEMVPLTLYPNQQFLARKLIAQSQQIKQP